MPLEPSSSADAAPPDRFCDLVMKGGITSGVVYPLAILELARSYRFKNIGGTSAGAIAGVVTAAAEYRRRHGSSAGFESLRTLPAQLGEAVGAPPPSQSRLLSLFQPAASTQRLFRALLATLNRPSTGQRWLGALIGLVSAYAGAALLGALLGALLAGLLVPRFHARTLIAMLLLGAIGALAAVAVALYRDITRGLVPNGFGLCDGGPGTQGTASTPPALSPWLHELIQTTAGRGASDAPLTFQDLWDAPGFPPPWLQAAVRGPVRSINLQVFTTNLTHGRPYHLPLDDASSRLFFKARELEKYFPAAVVSHMVKCSQPYRALSALDPDASTLDAEARELRELPGGELPIVVAARLSLSFPVLISALPLWAIDHETRTLKRCWFSDGGICSNFPIHLFDGFVPMWPTFGISLGKRSPDRATDIIWLPQQHEEGRDDAWNRFDDKPDAIGRLGGFVASIVSAAQNWNDATGTRMPGVRDRVVQIKLKPEQGGLNLAMPAPLIKELSGYGREAGAALAQKFLAGDDGTAARGWREHRWVRFNVLLVALRERARALGIAADLTQHALPLRAQIAQAQTAPPLAGEGEAALSAEQGAALQRLLDAIEQLEQAFDAANAAQPYQPSPLPSIRVRSPL